MDAPVSTPDSDERQPLVATVDPRDPWIHGVVDAFRKPATLSGWVVCVPGEARKLLVTVSRGGRRIGQAYPNHDRRDVKGDDIANNPDSVAGFEVVCDEAITDGDLVAGAIEVRPSLPTAPARCWASMKKCKPELWFDC